MKKIFNDFNFIFVGYPTFIFHELCHILVLILFNNSIKILKYDYKFTINHYHLVITIEPRYYYLGFICAIAPILGIYFLIVLTIFYNFYFGLVLICYGCIFGSLLPSDEDFEMMSYSLDGMRKNIIATYNKFIWNIKFYILYLYHYLTI